MTRVWISYSAVGQAAAEMLAEELRGLEIEVTSSPERLDAAGRAIDPAVGISKADVFVPILSGHPGLDAPVTIETGYAMATYAARGLPFVLPLSLRPGIRTTAYLASLRTRSLNPQVSLRSQLAEFAREIQEVDSGVVVVPWKKADTERALDEARTELVKAYTEQERAALARLRRVGRRRAVVLRTSVAAATIAWLLGMLLIGTLRVPLSPWWESFAPGVLGALVTLTVTVFVSTRRRDSTA